MIITLKDGSSKEYAAPMSVILQRISAKGWQELPVPGKLTEKKWICGLLWIRIAV